jgi:hypothetical protein
LLALLEGRRAEMQGLFTSERNSHHWGWGRP